MVFKDGKAVQYRRRRPLKEQIVAMFEKSLNTKPKKKEVFVMNLLNFLWQKFYFSKH